MGPEPQKAPSEVQQVAPPVIQNPHLKKVSPTVAASDDFQDDKLIAMLRDQLRDRDDIEKMQREQIEIIEEELHIKGLQYGPLLTLAPACENVVTPLAMQLGEPRRFSNGTSPGAAYGGACGFTMPPSVAPRL